MRVTVDRDDRDFIRSENFGRYEVLLNGKRLDKVEEASTDRGYAVVLTPNDQGRMHIDPATGEIARHCVLGRIEIIDALDVPGSDWRKARGLD